MLHSHVQLTFNLRVDASRLEEPEAVSWAHNQLLANRISEAGDEWSTVLMTSDLDLPPSGIETIYCDSDPDGNCHRLVNIDKAGKLLNVSRTTIYSMVNRDEIKATRISGRRFIPAAEIEALIRGENQVKEGRPT